MQSKEMNLVLQRRLQEKALVNSVKLGSITLGIGALSLASLGGSCILLCAGVGSDTTVEIILAATIAGSRHSSIDASGKSSSSSVSDWKPASFCQTCMVNNIGFTKVGLY